MMKATREHLSDFLSFLNRSVSPFHAVDQAKTRLGAQGFKEVRSPFLSFPVSTVPL